MLLEIMLGLSIGLNVVLVIMFLASKKKSQKTNEDVKKNSDYKRYKELQSSHDVCMEAFETVKEWYRKLIKDYEELNKDYNEWVNAYNELVNSREYEADDDTWRKLNSIIEASIYDRELYDKLININPNLYEGVFVVDNSLAEYSTDEEGNIVAFENLEELEWYYLHPEDLRHNVKFYFDYVSEINEPQIETYM